MDFTHTRIRSTALAILENDVALSLPFTRSPFKVLEYAALLRHFPGSTVYSTRVAEQPSMMAAEAGWAASIRLTSFISAVGAMTIRQARSARG